MSTRATFDENTLNDHEGSGYNTPRLSAPIDIPGAKTAEGADDRPSRRRGRRRVPSDASSASGDSSLSRDSPSPPTPSSAEQSAGEASTSPVDSATSPLLSYFLANASPTSTNRRFSYKNRRKSVNGPAPVLEEEEAPELPHVLHHARRLSSSWAQAGTIGVQQKGPITGSQQERHTSLMRRLSLGGGAQRPTLPTYSQSPQSILEPIPQKGLSTSFTEQRPSTPRGHPRRSATISTPQGMRPNRPPSPMGERMLKGHFDGF